MLNTEDILRRAFMGIRLFGALNTADSIPTVIPDEDIGLDDDKEQYHSCEALIMHGCGLCNCRWCGKEDYDEPVTSIPE